MNLFIHNLKWWWGLFVYSLRKDAEERNAKKPDLKYISGGKKW